jgi:hypothetical protein
MVWYGGIPGTTLGARLQVSTGRSIVPFNLGKVWQVRVRVKASCILGILSANSRGIQPIFSGLKPYEKAQVKRRDDQGYC